MNDAFNNGSWRFWTVGMSERALSAWWAATGDCRVPRTLENVFGFADMSRRFGGRSATFLSGLYDTAEPHRREGTPRDKGVLHSGTGRIACLPMHPMSLFESGGSSGSVSLTKIVAGEDIGVAKVDENYDRGYGKLQDRRQR